MVAVTSLSCGVSKTYLGGESETTSTKGKAFGNNVSPNQVVTEDAVA